jgi:hypothetical protein
METATVIVTDISGKGKKIFHYGDQVTEQSFPAGKFQKLLAGKFIKLNEVVAEVKPAKEELEENEGFELESNEATESQESEELKEEKEGFSEKRKKKHGKK